MQGQADVLKEMLENGGNVLSQAVDENRRSGLHFTAAVGNEKCTRILCEAGADPDLGDKDGECDLMQSTSTALRVSLSSATRLL